MGALSGVLLVDVAGGRTAAEHYGFAGYVVEVD